MATKTTQQQVKSEAELRLKLKRQPRRCGRGNCIHKRRTSRREKPAKAASADVMLNLRGLRHVDQRADAHRQGMGTRTLRSFVSRNLFLQVLAAQTEKSGLIFSEGVLETLPDGFGFLRAHRIQLSSRPRRHYVSPSQIRKFDLRTGDPFRTNSSAEEGERYFALIKVEAINFDAPEQSREKFSRQPDAALSGRAAPTWRSRMIPTRISASRDRSRNAAG